MSNFAQELATIQRGIADLMERRAIAIRQWVEETVPDLGYEQYRTVVRHLGYSQVFEAELKEAAKLQRPTGWKRILYEQTEVEATQLAELTQKVQRHLIHLLDTDRPWEPFDTQLKAARADLGRIMAKTQAEPKPVLPVKRVRKLPPNSTQPAVSRAASWPAAAPTPVQTFTENRYYDNTTSRDNDLLNFAAGVMLGQTSSHRNVYDSTPVLMPEEPVAEDMGSCRADDLGASNFS